MSIREQVRNKQTIITSRLARAFLMAKEGDRIPTINDYAQIFSVGSGTVQSAVQQLKQEGAIEVEARGFLGSYITKLDYNKLWELSDFGILLGLFPLNTSIKIRGLAAGIHKCFAPKNIPLHISFMQGSVNRIHTLLGEKCDFVVMSQLAFLQAVKDGEAIEKVIDLGEGTYHEEMVFLTRKGNGGAITQGSTVGIDIHSYGQAALMGGLDRKLKLQYIPKHRDEFVDSVRRGEIHAAIVDKGEIQLYDGELEFSPFPEELRGMLEQATRAVVVARKDSDELRKILAKKINPKTVKAVQTEILNRDFPNNGRD